MAALAGGAGSASLSGGAEKKKKLFKCKRVAAYDGGIGAFAAADMPKGTLILREMALLATTGEDFERDVADLDEPRRRQLFSLCDWRAAKAGEAKTALGIVQSNGYPIPAREGAGVFLNFSRFNHSCLPNISHKCIGDEKFVFAARDISEGEELLNNYVQLDQPTEARQSELRDNFGFVCMCVACSRTGDAASTSDQNRAELRRLDGEVFGHVRNGRYEQAIASAERALSLLELEGLDAPATVVRTCFDAFQAMEHSGNRQGQRDWLLKVIEHTELCDSPDSEELQSLRNQLQELSV